MLVNDVSPLPPPESKEGNNETSGKSENTSENHDVITTKQYGLHILHIAVSLIGILLACLSFLYAVGQLFRISVSNFWCNKSYTIDEIRSINLENGNEEGKYYSCLRTDGFVDYDKLFAKNPNKAIKNEYDSANQIRNIFLCFGYCLPAIANLYYVFRHKKNVDYIKSKNKNKNKNTSKTNNETIIVKNATANNNNNEKKIEIGYKNNSNKKTSKHDKRKKRKIIYNPCKLYTFLHLYCM